MKKNISLVGIVLAFVMIVVLLYTNILSNMFNGIFGFDNGENTSDLIAATKKAAASNSGGDMTNLLARLINGEARGEKYLGQVAVGAVVMNRVRSSKFPNSISGVIYQKGQFSCVTDGQFNKPIDKNSTVYKAAREAINGADPTNGALFFYNARTAKSKWIYSRPTVKVIGKHTFAK